MDNVRYLPGASTTLAPGPRPGPVDLDAVGDRYTALLEAREVSSTSVIAMLADASADDVPGLVAEVHRVEVLRRDLAAEVDRVTALVAAVRALHVVKAVTGRCAPDCGVTGCHEVICAACGTEVGAGPCPTVATLDGGGSDG